MKFLTLTLKDDDAVRGYDFATGEGDLTPEEIIEAIEHVLFGNDALFDGQILLTAKYDGNNFVVKRDFAEDKVEVTHAGEVLSRSQASEVLDGLAALGKKQWKEYLSPVDADAFLHDCADYVEKRLAAMGFDREELERRSLSYATERDRALSQVEILDELVAEDDVKTELHQAKMRAEALRAEIAESDAAAQADAERTAAANRADELNAELQSELAKEEDINRFAERLKSNESLKAALPVYARVLELQKLAAESNEELRTLTADLESAETDLNKDKALAEEKKKNYTYYSDRVNALRDEFYTLLNENDADGAVTSAILEKMGETNGADALNAFVEWDKKFYFLAKDLSATRLDYKKRRSIREGIAFETTMEDMETQIKTIEDAIRARKDLTEALKSDRKEEGEEDFLTLYRAKILCDVYRAEIAAEENKIRENETAQRKIDEDILALEKAKSALELYMERSSKKNDELTDRLTGVAARKSFCTDVSEMQYGAICPVCNNRITDKAEHLREIEKLAATEARLTSDLTAGREALQKYSEKALSVNMRLGQLREKKRLSVVYVDSLNASVGRKQDLVKETLEKTGAKDLDDLAKKCAAGAKGDGEALLSLLAKRIEGLNGETERLEKQAESLRATVSDMRDSYEDEILPSLDGKRAYDFLETIVADEQTEDEKFAELIKADDERSKYLDEIITGGDPARVVRAANQVFSEVVSDIRRNEELLQKSLDEYTELNETIAEKTEDFNKRLARADEILSRIEIDRQRADELLAFVHADAIDEDAYAALQKDLLTDDEVAAYKKAIDEYDYRVTYLKKSIEDLPFGDETPDVSGRQEKVAELNALATRIAELEKVVATSEAAFSLAMRRTEECDKLLEKYELTKKLADGEVSDVILPVINDALTAAGETVVATTDGLGLSFVKKGNKGDKTVSAD
ncbi:MAG: hypothetical protein IJ735_05495, partial [Clostridia bacterium]|nr:hypothetical protein [Clostridia bacterium]